MRICIAGGGGFIGSHLGKKLLESGAIVIAADWKKNEYFEEKEFCTEFKLLDLRILKNCIEATKDCELVFMLAADMGGMGYIQSNNSVILFNNTMITFNMIEACRRNSVKKILYTSSACIYPVNKQDTVCISPLKESEAWPAYPQDSYGLEKLSGEELLMHYGRDFSIQIYIARLHNIYGPYGTWKDGREKAPAAFCRKIACSDNSEIEMWGDGKQTRSFCYIDDCIEGLIRLVNSDYHCPLNIGSDEAISMNDMHSLICSFEKKEISARHIVGPEGVRGRCSDNTLVKSVLGWAPSIKLEIGLKKLYDWIKTQLALESDILQYKGSIVLKQTIETLDTLN